MDGALLAARKLMPATGIVDIFSAIDSFSRFREQPCFTILNCHARESRDKPLVAYGNGSHAVEPAVLLRA